MGFTEQISLNGDLCQDQASPFIVQVGRLELNFFAVLNKQNRLNSVQDHFKNIRNMHFLCGK